MNKKLGDEKEQEPILAKYKKPSKEVKKEQEEERDLKQKRKQKEEQRIMGRHIPTADDDPHKRELQIIACKGGKNQKYLTFGIVVQLFNTVTEFQSTSQKEALEAEQ